MQFCSSSATFFNFRTSPEFPSISAFSHISTTLCKAYLFRMVWKFWTSCVHRGTFENKCDNSEFIKKLSILAAANWNVSKKREKQIKPTKIYKLWIFNFRTFHIWLNSVNFCPAQMPATFTFINFQFVPIMKFKKTVTFSKTRFLLATLTWSWPNPWLSAPPLLAARDEKLPGRAANERRQPLIYKLYKTP